MKFIINYIKSMRLYYAFVTGIPGWLGVAYYESIVNELKLEELGLKRKLVILTLLFLSWGINQIVNDYLGLEEDRINAPERPMVTGQLNPKKALLTSGIILFLILVYTYFYLSPLAVIPLIAGVGLNVVYEYAKGKGILGNIVFGVMILTTSFFGMLAAGNLPLMPLTKNLWGGSILIITINGMMTFYTYFKDYKGDKKAGKKTLIVKYGLKKSKYLSLIVSVVPTTLFLILYKLGVIKGNVGFVFIFLGIVSTFLFLWTGILFYLNPIGEKTYFSLETNFKACTCSQAALLGLFNEKLALVLFISSYIFVEFLFSLYSNSRA